MRDIPVSVVMPVFNAGVYLREAVESILAQTFEDFEFIIVDDGSTDDSPEILREYARRDPRIQIFSQENRGVIEALNRGFGVAQGRYIARMDADDVALPDRLRWQVEYLERHDRVGLLGGAVSLIDHSGAPLGVVQHPETDAEIRATLGKHNCFTHPAVLLRRAVVEEMHCYRRAFVHAEEYDLWLRMAERCQMANLPDPVLRYRIHEGQVSSGNLRAQVLSACAARLAARQRAERGLDQFDDGRPVTLEELQVADPGAALEREMVLAHLWWAECLMKAGYAATAERLLADLAASGVEGYAPRALRARAHTARWQLFRRRGRILRGSAHLLGAWGLRALERLRSGRGAAPIGARGSLRGGTLADL